MYRGICSDFNTNIELGMYIVNINTINRPSNAYSYGVLEVFGGSTFLAQRYTPHANYAGNFGEYTRIRYNNIWENWRFIPYQ